MIPTNISKSHNLDDEITPLTRELFEVSIPKRMRKLVTDEMIENINSLASNDIELEAYRDNIVTYASVLTEGKFKTYDYMKACVYVTHKMMGCTNIQAYAKTFPDRYAKYHKVYSDKDLQATISVYNKNKLVTAIMGKTIVPTYVQYQDLNAESIEVSATLMRTAKSEMVRQKAARDVFDMTKQPDELMISVETKKSENEDIVDRYKNALNFASEEMMKKIEAGADLSKMINVPLSKPEAIDVEPEDNTNV